MTNSTLPTFANPGSIAPPLGRYSHVAVAPAGARILAIAGQVGNARDGTVAPDIEAQYAQALRNIRAILESEGAGPEHLVKVNTYLVRPIDRSVIAATRSEILGEVQPPSTMVFVAALALPELLVEVEAWAALPD